MALVLAEPFAEFQTGARTERTRVALHVEDVVVDAMLPEQPLALAAVLGAHALLGLEKRRDIHVEIRNVRAVLVARSTQRLHETVVRYGVDRRRAGVVVGR